MTGKPIFFDPMGRRGPVLARLAWALGTISALVTVLFIATLMIVDQKGVEHSDPTANLAAGLRKEERALRTKHPQAEVVDRRPVPVSLAPPGDRSLSIGFYANWDDNSYPALKRVLPHLDWIIPGWLSLEGPDMELKSDVDTRVLSYIQTTKPNIPILPMIQNAGEGAWNGEGLARLLADPVARAARIEQMMSFLDKNKFQGLTIDFEEVPAAAQKNLQLFLTEMAAAFAPHWWIGSNCLLQ